MSAIVVPFHSSGRETEQTQSETFVKTFIDKSYGIQWQILSPEAPRRITRQLLAEILSHQNHFISEFESTPSLQYQVFSSEVPDVFSLGGDLSFFAQCSRNNDSVSLQKYAYDAVKAVYSRYTNFNLPVTTINLVKGAATGGGFEAALGANYLIAEEQANFSFPETRFGLFPGMGAYTFLRQRVPNKVAEEIIYSGRTYTAEELCGMGIVDLVCPKGEGDSATLQFIRQRHQQHTGIHAMREMVQKFSPINRDELFTIVDHWIDSVMKLDHKQLRLIEALSGTTEGFSNKQVTN